jgi:hypothetical protein
MRKALIRFLRRPGPQRRLLVRAGLTLVVMRVATRLPFTTLARVLGLRQGQTPEEVRAETVARAAAVGWAIRAAASYLPWESTCLVRALAGAVLLRRSQIGGTLYLGVATETEAAEGMSAHAWLRCGELVLTGEAERARYTPVASFVCRDAGIEPDPRPARALAGARG